MNARNSTKPFCSTLRCHFRVWSSSARNRSDRHRHGSALLFLTVVLCVYTALCFAVRRDAPVPYCRKLKVVAASHWNTWSTCRNVVRIRLWCVRTIRPRNEGAVELMAPSVLPSGEERAQSLISVLTVSPNAINS